MSFTFRVKGSFYSVVSEMLEVELKAKEESMEVHIDKTHLLDGEPYITVTCPDQEKGKALTKRVEDEAPRFLRL